MKKKAFHKTTLRKEKVKRFLIKALIVLVISAVAFFLFILLMCYLVACGVAAGYEIRI